MQDNSVILMLLLMLLMLMLCHIKISRLTWYAPVSQCWSLRNKLVFRRLLLHTTWQTTQRDYVMLFVLCHTQTTQRDYVMLFVTLRPHSVIMWCSLSHSDHTTWLCDALSHTQTTQHDYVMLSVTLRPHSVIMWCSLSHSDHTTWLCDALCHTQTTGCTLPLCKAQPGRPAQRVHIICILCDYYTENILLASLWYKHEYIKQSLVTCC